MAWMILALAPALLPQEEDAEAIRRQLHEILGRTEFRQKMPSDFWARLRESIRLRSPEPEPVELPDPGPCQVSSGGTGFSGGLMNVLFILAVAILAAFLIAIGYHAWTRRAIPHTGTPLAVAAVAASAMPDPLARDSQEWAFEADRLFREGRIAEAIRALYLAALSHSHVRRWIDYHPSKPNWEHVRRFSGPGPARTILGSLTSVFERKWYGRKPADDSEYRSSREMTSALLESREPPP